MNQQYFDWIYTQFVSENLFFNIILHKTDMFGRCLSSYFSVSYYTKDGNRAHKRFPASLSENIFQADINNAILYIDIKKENIKVVGQITLTPSNQFKQNLYSKNSDLFSNWDVIIPHGFFTGVIQINDIIYAKSATVYQDRQYGSLPIQYFLDRWGWSVVVCNNVTKGMFSILSKDGTAITISFECDGVLLFKSVEKRFAHIWVDSLNICTPNFDINRCLLGVDIDYQHPIRQREYEKYDIFDMSYYRYACIRDNLICGACEYMKINIGGKHNEC